MWRAALSAGFTVPMALESMGRREAPTVESMRCWLLGGTRKGRSVGDLVRTGAARFEDFERSLLTLGDESGSLENSMTLLGDFYTKKNQLMQNVRKQMAYPLFTGLCATFIAPLPLVFQDRIAAYFLVVVAGLVGWILAGGSIIAAAAGHYGRKPAMVRARLARSLATAIGAGLPLPRALRLAANATADPSVMAFVNRLNERQLTEQSPARTLAACPHLTPDFLGALTVAERTGDYATTMAKLADLYEDGFR